MIANITWLQFTVAMLAILVIYYTYVLLRYRLPGGREDEASDFYTGAAPYPDEPEGEDEGNEELFRQAESLVSALQEIIWEDGREMDKEELLPLLAYELKKYPALAVEKFRDGINQLISDELEKKYSLVLDAVDLEGLWNS